MGRFKPAGAAKHGFNDLVIRKNGEVITTDSLANAVFQFDRAAHTFKPCRFIARFFIQVELHLGGNDHYFVCGG